MSANDTAKTATSAVHRLSNCENKLTCIAELLTHVNTKTLDLSEAGIAGLTEILEAAKVDASAAKAYIQSNIERTQ